MRTKDHRGARSSPWQDRSACRQRLQWCGCQHLQGQPDQRRHEINSVIVWRGRFMCLFCWQTGKPGGLWHAARQIAVQLYDAKLGCIHPAFVHYMLLYNCRDEFVRHERRQCAPAGCGRQQWRRKQWQPAAGWAAAMAARALLAVAISAAPGPPCSEADARRLQVGFSTLAPATAGLGKQKVNWRRCWLDTVARRKAPFEQERQDLWLSCWCAVLSLHLELVWP